MYHGQGTSVLGMSISSGAGGGTVAATQLPFTGLPLDIISAILAAMLALSVGIVLVRLGRLTTGDRAVKAPRFSE